MAEQSEFDRQLRENQRFYDEHRDEIRARYAGQYIGIASAKIIAADRDFHAICRVMEALAPPPQHMAVFLADDEPEMDACLQSSTAEYK